MRSKTVIVILLAVVISVLPIMGLLVHEVMAQTSGCTTTATAKCLYPDGRSGDCGSCTCQGVGVNGKCGIANWDPAGCMCNRIFTSCHQCNAPGGGGGGGGPGDPIPT
jgi:hypothetical protein